MTLEEARILIVEDEILVAEDIKDSLEQFGVRKLMMAHDKEAALLALKVFDPHIVLLDIRMERRMDGLEIAEYIRSHYRAAFIFLTAHSDLAMVKEIVKTKPVGYITKPFKKSDLFAILNLAVAQQQEEKSRRLIKIKEGHQVLLVEEDEINYIEAQGNYVMINYAGKRVLSRQSLESIQQEVDGAMFFRVGKSFIVNCNKIVTYTKSEVKVVDKVIPVSRKVADEFVDFMKKL